MGGRIVRFLLGFVLFMGLVLAANNGEVNTPGVAFAVLTGIFFAAVRREQ